MGRAYTTYFGELDDRSYTRRVLAVSTSSNPLATSDVDIGATQVSTTVAASPTGGHDNNSTGKGGSSTPLGAIVGGVVGGVAVLAIVALALFFIIRHNNKKKQQQQNIAAATGGYPQMTQQPGGGPNNGPTAPPAAAAGAHQSVYNPAYGQQQQQQYPSPTQSPPPQQAFMNPQQQQQAPPYTFAGDIKPQAYAHVQPPSPAASPGIDHHNRQSYNQLPASPTMADVSSIQPHHTGSTMGGGGVYNQYGKNGSGPSVPTTVHEAGGDAAGIHGPHSNHHGQFHEMQ